MSSVAARRASLGSAIHQERQFPRVRASQKLAWWAEVLEGDLRHDEPGQLVGWQWPSDEVALGLVSADRAQEIESLLRLDPLGAGGDAERVRQTDDRSHDGLGFTASADGGDERAVDLYLADRHPVELNQRREARAEIVDGDPNSAQ